MTQRVTPLTPDCLSTHRATGRTVLLSQRHDLLPLRRCQLDAAQCRTDEIAGASASSHRRSFTALRRLSTLLCCRRRRGYQCKGEQQAIDSSHATTPSLFGLS
jgi:hypothetical protein